MTIDLSVIALAVVVGFVLAALMATFRYIPNDRVGIVEKLWSPSGSLKSGLIALNGEAGFQPALLRGGWHLLLPFQYRIHKMPLVTIPQGKIGYVFARDGQPLPPTQTLASNVAAERLPGRRRVPARRRPARTAAQDPARGHLRDQPRAVRRHHERADPLPAARRARSGHLRADGEAHRRARRLRAGRHQGRRRRHRHRHRPRRPVARRTGRSSRRRSATIPRMPRPYHNNFQDPERFLQAGGLRGRQLQVLVEGTYYINRLFATVELIPKTVVEVGNVGVVVSYTGEPGADLSGDEYKHGELVDDGTARRLERAAAARQVRVQHVRRQGDRSCRRRTSS